MQDVIQNGTGVEGNTSSSLFGSLLNFSYKDYLRMFVLLRINGKEQDDMISRIADCIELNVKSGLKNYYGRSNTVKWHPAGYDFSMAKAYTYVEIQTRVKVKPLLLSQGVFSNGTPLDFWSYEYSNVSGY